MLHLLFELLLLALTVPVVMFVLECLLGILPARRIPLRPTEHLRCAILMPAHNEALVIANTLENLKRQLGDNDSLVVIADNCSDNTAELVRQHGLFAIERQSDSERGKGYALAFGMEYLKGLPQAPDMVVIVDADCLLADNALAQLKNQVAATQRPAQACYLMQRGEVERIAIKVSEFAFMVKNKIRLRGLARLGMPVPLTGTGMAFPWEAIAQAQLATGDIVEDMRLGVELAEQGKGAGYCDAALVTSFFPSSEAAEKTQRERWEHGHLSTLRQFVPRLLRRAISERSLQALGMMLDLLIPPLSLLVMLIGASCGLFLVWGLLFAEWQFASYAFDLLIALLCTILLVWLLYGRSILSLREMAHIPVYIVSKIVIYIGYLLRKQTKWIRTDRN